MNKKEKIQQSIITLIFQQKYLKHTIVLHFTELSPQKTAKYGQQVELTKKTQYL